MPNRILTVQERCTWCCWVMMMAKGVRARPTSSSAWVKDTSVLRKIKSTTIPKSRTFRPTVSAYSLQLVLKHKYRSRHRHRSSMKWKHSMYFEYLERCFWSRISFSSYKQQTVDILLGFVDNNYRAVDRTVSVMTPLEFFIVLPIQFITPAFFWS